MKEYISQSVVDASQSPKVAAVVATSTTGTGLATTFDWIPFGLGEIATALGICLSCVLIITHVIQHKAKMRLINAEIESLERS